MREADWERRRNQSIGEGGLAGGELQPGLPGAVEHESYNRMGPTLRPRVSFFVLPYQSVLGSEPPLEVGPKLLASAFGVVSSSRKQTILWRKQQLWAFPANTPAGGARTHQAGKGHFGGLPAAIVTGRNASGEEGEGMYMRTSQLRTIHTDKSSTVPVNNLDDTKKPTKPLYVGHATGLCVLEHPELMLVSG